MKDLSILPIFLFLAIGLSLNGQDTEKITTAVELGRMNVLYMGVSNPVKIASSGFKPEELLVSIDNGTIAGANGNYEILPERKGRATLLVKVKDSVINRTIFRVKPFTELAIMFQFTHMAMIYDSSWKDKHSIAGFLNVKKLNLVAKDSDYDVQLEINEFTLSVEIDGKNVEAVSSGNNFSDNQLALLKNMEKGGKVIIDDIGVKTEDGSIRWMAPMLFRLH